MTTQIVLPGQAYQKSHQDSVNAILGSVNAPPVTSDGDSFYNVAQWTALELINVIAKGKKISKVVPSGVSNKIVIAKTPDKLPLGVAYALTGGAYHEAFHSYYDRQGPMTQEELKAIRSKLKERPWASTLARIQKPKVLTWHNVIADIRIERLGCQEFPGVQAKMEILADFVCEREAHHYDRFQAADWLMLTFRDLGKGYRSPGVLKALAEYQRRAPDVWDMVTKGALKPLLDQSIALTREDHFEAVLLALDLLHTLQEMAEKKPEPQQSQDQDQDQESDDQDQDSGQGQDSEDREGEEDEQSQDNQGSQGGAEAPPFGDEEEDSDDQGPEGLSSSSEEEEGEDSQGSGAGEGSGEEGEDSESSEGPGDPDEGESENTSEGEGSSEGSGEDSDPSDSSSESKGNSEEASEAGGRGATGADPGSVAQEILRQQIQAGGMESALKEAIKDAWRDTDKDTQGGERPWRPNTDATIRTIATPENEQRSKRMRNTADALLADLRPTISGLKAKLRRIVKAAEMRGVVHGTRKGRALSQRYMVDTVATLRRGRQPGRAYYQIDEAQDTSLAAFVSVDLSGSMRDHMSWLRKFIFAIVNPLDALGCKTMVSGFSTNPGAGCVCHHVIKTWDESAKRGLFKERVMSTSPLFGTPTADAVQLGIKELNGRREGRRVLFVLTDGSPAMGHDQVLRYQQRISREHAGIHIVGVGMGRGARKVRTLFDDHIWVDKMSELPPLLIKKMIEIMNPETARKRGKKVRS